MKKAIDRYGLFILREAFLTASYSELGRDDEAKEMAQQLLKRHPKFSLKSWKYAKTYKNPEDTERLLNALRILRSRSEHQNCRFLAILWNWAESGFMQVYI